jgi:hypothetical protein
MGCPGPARSRGSDWQAPASAVMPATTAKEVVAPVAGGRGSKGNDGGPVARKG